MADVVVDTEGLYPGVYAIQGDADVYCLDCARRIYGAEAIDRVVSGERMPNMYDYESVKASDWPRDGEGNFLHGILASEEALENVYCGSSSHDDESSLLALGCGYVDASSEPVLKLHYDQDEVLRDADGTEYDDYDMRGYLDNLYGQSCERCHKGLDQTAYIGEWGDFWCYDCVTID